ncbi:MAG: oligopeptidase A [Pseudomonadales bacterium]
MTNPLLEFHELPPFGNIKPEHVVSAIDELLEINRRTIGQLLDQGEQSWDGLIRIYEELDDRLAQSFGPVSHLNSVMNSPELRQAYDACLPKISEYTTEMRQNPELFAAYKKIASSDEYKSLDKARQKAVDNAIRDAKLSGIDLSKEHQQRFAAISKRLSELGSQFNNNVLDATMAWRKVINDVEELKGLPESALAQARQTAEQRGESGYLFTLDIPSYLPVMTYCENEPFRKEMYEAFTTRASDEGPHAGQWDNSAIMNEMLALRTEQAHLLGFRNYAEQSLATKMARSTQEVMQFLGELAAKSRPRAETEFAEICEFARTAFGATEVNAWDVSFYAERLKQQLFDISDEELRPYFPAPKVINGMFEVVRRLYDLEIDETRDIETWHPDVTVYNIRKNDELIARFYLDAYARQNKRGGAWMDDCRVRRLTLDRGLQLPVAYLTCNFSAPVGDDPSLLTHDEVVTLFHEFGHGLHHMLTRVDVSDVSGINGVAWDAVELPSQFMENWCWEAEALEFISGHYKTGESLPRELLDKMLAAKNFQAAMMTVRQLEFALFDFRLHKEFEPGRDNQIQEVLDQVRAEVGVVKVPQNNRFQHGFGHIFGGGYAAGYYSYKWAEVLSADAFSVFKEEGIFNRQTGEKFLASILEQGGTVEAMDMFVAFRGREPDVEALLRQDGIMDR